jgi:hypothetical protein
VDERRLGWVEWVHVHLAHSRHERAAVEVDHGDAAVDPSEPGVTTREPERARRSIVADAVGLDPGERVRGQQGRCAVGLAGGDRQQPGGRT